MLGHGKGNCVQISEMLLCVCVCVCVCVCKWVCVRVCVCVCLCVCIRDQCMQHVKNRTMFGLLLHLFIINTAVILYIVALGSVVICVCVCACLCMCASVNDACKKNSVHLLTINTPCYTYTNVLCAWLCVCVCVC